MSFQPHPPEDTAGRIQGVAVGIVTDNEDPENMGRVKLRFPWRTVDDESYWARIATPMAGSEMGVYFLPEVGDEVLVAFEDGDIHHPYVVGSLWNGRNKPPEDNADGNNDIRTIQSRSGHEITFDDDAGGSLTIKTSSGHEIVLDDQSGGERIRIADTSGQNTIEFDATQGALSIESAATLSLNAPMIELKGTGNVTVEASGILSLQGSLVKIN